jgi:hypothetical protein
MRPAAWQGQPAFCQAIGKSRVVWLEYWSEWPGISGGFVAIGSGRCTRDEF